MCCVHALNHGASKPLPTDGAGIQIPVLWDTQAGPRRGEPGLPETCLNKTKHKNGPSGKECSCVPTWKHTGASASFQPRINPDPHFFPSCRGLFVKNRVKDDTHRDRLCPRTRAIGFYLEPGGSLAGDSCWLWGRAHSLNPRVHSKQETLLQGCTRSQEAPPAGWEGSVRLWFPVPQQLPRSKSLCQFHWTRSEKSDAGRGREWHTQPLRKTLTQSPMHMRGSQDLKSCPLSH